jgi:hypothetical protein
MDKYSMAFACFTEAIKRYPEIIDTTRIGIFGQSFGAGAVPWVAKKVFTEMKWGDHGAFLLVSAPWYYYGVTDEDLHNIPSKVKLLIIIYDDDVFNDHQMAVDLFRSTTSIPLSEKCFVTMYSDTLDSIILPANHFVPYSSENVNGVIDQFDYYGLFRLFDALAAYAFEGDTLGKHIALGDGSKEQCYLGEWHNETPVKPFSVSKNPRPEHPALLYFFSWDNRLNPRRDAIEYPWQKKPK